MSDRHGEHDAPHTAGDERACDSALDEVNDTPHAADQNHGREDELEAGFDLDGEALMAVAPIGPTEIAEPTLPVPPDSANDPGPPVTAEELEQQIRELEARLDGMMHRTPDEDERGSRRAAAELAGRASVQAHAGTSRPYPPAFIEPLQPEGATARELLSSSFYQRELGRTGIRNRSEQIDEFGLDPAYELRIRRLFDFLYRFYFRVETEGTEQIPNEGRCLIVSNHTGGPLPYDGPMLRTAVRRQHPKHRELRWLAEDFIYYLPFAGTFMSRLGAVRACQENAERLLSAGNLVAVFPEGAKGIGKLYRDRYRLQRFGRGGFIRLCLRTKTPLVPCAIVGAEEANPMLYRIEYLTKAFGIPYLPITPTFPALGPLGLLPAPTKWKIRFGEIVRFDDYGPEASDDEILIGRLAERVRMAIQSLLDTTLSEPAIDLVRVNASGILVIDKPVGPTSHDVVAAVRRALSIRRAGHAGTLDPMASGVLVVLLGEGTKLAPFLTAHDKSYDARVVLGRATTTLDAHGEPTFEQPLPPWLVEEIERIGSPAPLAPDALAGAAPRMRAALASERGRMLQQPPAFSAIQIGGRRSYDRARAGENVVLHERPVRVASMNIVRAAIGPEQATASVDIDLTVSKGYYVRSLARDLGAALGVPAHLGALRRTRSGPFDLGAATALHAGSRALEAAIEPLSGAAARCLPRARLCPSAIERARHGKRLTHADFLDPLPRSDGPFAWLDPDGRLVAIGSRHHDTSTADASRPSSIPTSELDAGQPLADEFAVLRGFSE